MKRVFIITLLLVTVASATAAENDERSDFAKMKQILHFATRDLAARDYRVVFSAEDSQASMNLRHWTVTLQNYPADYKPRDDRSTGIVFGGPPCPPGKSHELCSVTEIPGEILFLGRFDLDDAKGHFRRFEGNIVATAARMSAFRERLGSHPEWTQADIADALESAGAKFGPNKEKEFRATLSVASSELPKAFGPMRMHRVSSMRPNFLMLPSKERVLIGWPAYWKVIMIPLQRPKDRIVMYFEPFEGQLQQVVVTGLFQKWDSKTKKFKWEYLDPDEK